jgi:hypothetical protein
VRSLSFHFHFFPAKIRHYLFHLFDIYPFLINGTMARLSYITIWFSQLYLDFESIGLQAFLFLVLIFPGFIDLHRRLSLATSHDFSRIPSN